MTVQLDKYESVFKYVTNIKLYFKILIYSIYKNSELLWTI